MIQVQALSKRYGPTKAVDDLSFEVLPGHVTGFLGPNGSGKSTTMRMIMGLDAPDSGQAHVNRHPYRDLAWPLREVGGLLDADGFHPGRSPHHHLLALAQANDLPRERVPAVLEQVGLTSVARRRVGTFSLGMAQRLGIAAALLGDPGILLFDEPVNGLDPEGIRWFRTLARELASEGRTVLLSSHLISEMAMTADYLVIIGRGRLIAELSMQTLAARAPAFVRVCTPETNRLAARLAGAGMRAEPQPDGSLSVTGAEARAIAAQAAAAGIALDELSPRRTSLEDVFMALTDDSVQYRAESPAQPAPPTEVHAGSTSGRIR